MTSGGYKWIFINAAAKLAGICCLTLLICLCLYHFDNKYTATGPQAVGGELRLSEQAISDNPVIFLVDGWAYYGGRLLSPHDFVANRPVPDEYVFIGQYGGFDAGVYAADPHGSASYAMTILAPDEPRDYTLELPEIYSAYRAYINGRLVEKMGEPDHGDYFPLTGNRAVTFTAGGAIEILIAVSDFSHIYSGMVYPPAFGEPRAVSVLLSSRLVFRGVLAAFALAVGIMSILVGLVSKRHILSLLFGLLCIFFVGYTCYPVLETLIDAFYPFYAIENLSFCSMLFIVILIQKNILRQPGKIHMGLAVFGILMCAFSALMPFVAPSGSLAVIGAYSYGIMLYEWLTAAYLTYAAIRGLLRAEGGSPTVLAGGALAFDVTLIMDRLLPLHEPAVTGWLPEVGSFALVACIGLTVGKEVAAKFRDSAILEERASGMERLAEMQRTNYDMLMGRIEETRKAQHDLRHHMSMIGSLVQAGAYGELGDYVRGYSGAVASIPPVSLTQNIVVGVLAKSYSQIAEKHGIDINFRLNVERDVKMSEADLCAALSNLLENAIEACRRQSEGRRYITLSIGQTASTLSIEMENSTDGKVAWRGGRLWSSKAAGREGYGLESVRAAALRYNGGADFRFDNEKNVFHSTVLFTF